MEGNNKIVRAYIGGTLSYQQRYYTPQKAAYSVTYKFEELSLEELKRRKYTSREYCEWAFGGHAFFQLAHPLQENDLPWDYNEFQSVIVEYATEFVNKGGRISPSKPSQMGCNILLQNKFGYISKVPDMFIPSFKLNRTEDGELDEETKGKLWDFLTEYYELHRDHLVGGFVFKAPFTTASKGIAWPKSFTEILDTFKSWCLNPKFDNLSYFFVQPRLANRQVSFDFNISILRNHYKYFIIKLFFDNRSTK